MKIAALADIHGNYQALITVLEHIEGWKPDLVIVLGDIINRGPRSRDCLHLIQGKLASHSWHAITGNHEQYVLHFSNPDAPKSGPEFEMLRIIHWTYQSLSPADIQSIKELPLAFETPLAGNHKLKAVHASMAGIRVGIYPTTSQEEILNLIQPEMDLFLVGHTHQPLVKVFGKTTVINAGSIGLPFDGDNRAGYAQITLENKKWKGKIIRLPYDLEAAQQDYYNTEFISEGGPLANLVLTEMKIAWPQLSHWFHRFEDAVLNQQITVKDAVEEYIKNPNLK
ncbi:MAG: metallophosphatase family protein [Anaerolineales bacterium]|nr:metallophosphatase family protein [Anaerolineales bacterium]